MPYDLLLPALLKAQGWKVKIRDKERLEEPHVSILRTTTTWRLGLRTGRFLDTSPDPKPIPRELLALIQQNHALLIEQWNIRYPENPA